MLIPRVNLSMSQRLSCSRQWFTRMLRLILLNSRGGMHPLYINTLMDFHKFSTLWTQMIFPSFTSKSTHNSQVIRTKLTTLQPFGWLSRKKIKSHILSMLIIWLASRDIRLEPTLDSSCHNKLMGTTSFTCMFQIQDLLTYLTRS